MIRWIDNNSINLATLGVIMKIKLWSLRHSFSAACLLSFAAMAHGQAQDADSGVTRQSPPRRAAAPSHSAQTADKSRVRVLERPAPAAVRTTTAASANAGNASTGNEVTRFQG